MQVLQQLLCNYPKEKEVHQQGCAFIVGTKDTLKGNALKEELGEVQEMANALSNQACAQSVERVTIGQMSVDLLKILMDSQLVQLLEVPVQKTR